MNRPPLARVLDLQPHPEGGWYRETWRAGVTVEPPGCQGPRATASGIYYSLGPREESRWHRVASDELWLWHRGGPLELQLGGDADRPGGDGQRRLLTLGPDVERGQLPQALVPAGHWQSARPSEAQEVLVSCVVSPGFDFADFATL